MFSFLRRPKPIDDAPTLPEPKILTMKVDAQGRFDRKNLLELFAAGVPRSSDAHTIAMAIFVLAESIDRLAAELSARGG